MYRTLRAFFLFALPLALLLGTIWAFFRLPFSWFIFLLPVVVPLLIVLTVAVVGRCLLPSRHSDTFPPDRGHPSQDSVPSRFIR
jgi:hypothetical protein